MYLQKIVLLLHKEWLPSVATDSHFAACSHASLQEQPYMQGFTHERFGIDGKVTACLGSEMTAL